jgi:hypothetical protein
VGSSIHPKTLLQNVSGLKSNRNNSPRRRTGPHTRLSQVWSALVLSLPFDTLWVFVPHSAIAEGYAQSLAIVCALITLPFLNQKRIASFLSDLRSLAKEPNKKNARTIQVALVLIVLLLIAAKLLVLPSIRTVVGALCATIVVVGALKGAQHVRQHQRQQTRELEDSPWLRVTLWEQQVVVIWCIALVAARLISLFASLSLNGTGVSELSISGFAASFLLLLCLKPNRAAFVGVCKKCKTPIPIAFVDYGSCPSCDKALQQLF